MFSDYFDAYYAIYLLIATVWTTGFSMTIRQPLRSCRNLGILACYILFIVMLFRLRFVNALATWCLFGFSGGAIYLAHELLVRWRTPATEEKPAVSAAALIHGPLAWPIMIPEAIENMLAELGILKTPPPSETPPPDLEKPQDASPAS